MSNPAETVIVESNEVRCEGGDGALGHPAVYLHLKNGEIYCPYCSKHFVLKEGAKAAAGH
ncbi:MAG: zinc-finger domain-containing protein [Magnetospiraceae bacterium]